MTRSRRKEDANIRQTFFFFKSVSTMSVRTYGTVLFVTSLLTYCSAFAFPTVQCMRHALLIQLRYEYCTPRDVTCPLLSLPPVGAYRFPRQRETPGGRASAYGLALRWIGRSGGDSVEIPSPDAVFIQKAVGRIIRVYGIHVNSPLSLIQEK